MKCEGVWGRVCPSLPCVLRGCGFRWYVFCWHVFWSDDIVTTSRPRFWKMCTHADWRAAFSTYSFPCCHICPSTRSPPRVRGDRYQAELNTNIQAAETSGIPMGRRLSQPSSPLASLDARRLPSAPETRQILDK